MREKLGFRGIAPILAVEWRNLVREVANGKGASDRLRVIRVIRRLRQQRLSLCLLPCRLIPDYPVCRYRSFFELRGMQFLELETIRHEARCQEAWPGSL